MQPNQAKELICGHLIPASIKSLLIIHILHILTLYNLSATQNASTFANLVSTSLIHVQRRPRISAIANAQHATNN